MHCSSPVLTKRFFIRNVLKSDACLQNLLPEMRDATSLVNCVMRKHLKFYQYEQKDFVKSFIRIVLLITNSAPINCVNGQWLCYNPDNWQYCIFIYTCVQARSLLLQDEINSSHCHCLLITHALHNYSSSCPSPIVSVFCCLSLIYAISLHAWVSALSTTWAIDRPI